MFSLFSVGHDQKRLNLGLAEKMVLPIQVIAIASFKVRLLQNYTVTIIFSPLPLKQTQITLPPHPDYRCVRKPWGPINTR